MTARITAWSAWMPGPDSETPPLDFLPSRARRRLSLLSRMALEVGHHLCDGADVDDAVFASRYGEIQRQLEITNGIIEDGEVSPSSFSHSVFNTPVALLSLHEGLNGMTRALYGGKHAIGRGLLQALLALEYRNRGPVLFVYGDEDIPELYKPLADGTPVTMALGILLNKTDQATGGSGVSVRIDNPGRKNSGAANPNDAIGLKDWLESNDSQYRIELPESRIVLTRNGH